MVLVLRTGESPLRSGDNNGTNFPVCINQTQGIIQFGEQSGVERVERFRAVERHECDPWLRARCEYVVVSGGGGGGGHEPEGWTEGELV